MRTVLKLTVRAVRCIPSRLYSGGRPPAPLGGRILTNPDDVFQHNMWDHVQWTEEEREIAQQKAEENSKHKIPVEEQTKYDRDANKYWDRFYEMHHGKFFRNRSWLFTEFPELLPPDVGGICSSEKSQDCCSSPPVCASFPGQHADLRILEVGCGAGNSVYPIINTIRGSKAFLYCCDFSSRAIQLVQEHPDYDPAVCHAFVRDICDTTSPFPFPPGSLDIILVVFVLSAIHPARSQKKIFERKLVTEQHWTWGPVNNILQNILFCVLRKKDRFEMTRGAQGVVNSLAGCLKQGGIVLFRDHGRYDLSQLRFKKGQCLSDNFYTRQDGTCVYFFTKDEVHHLFSNAGLEELQNLEDRRLQVNRGKKVVMHRVWMQSKYRRPYLLSSSV